MRKKKSSVTVQSPEQSASGVLPLSLRKRVSKLIPIDEILCPASSGPPDTIIRPKSPEMTVNIEPRTKPRPLPNVKEHWLDEYRSQTRKDRIKWNTKLYSRTKKFHHQTLYEQIDELADVAANEFAEWINTLGSDEKNRLNCETIKQLFSIGIEDDVSKSISIGMIQRPAISRELADMFDCPELSIERCVERILAADKRALRRQGKVDQRTVATPNTAITNFPEEIRSGKILFDGIEHLRPTKLLVKYLIENRHIPRPKFLQDIGAFKIPNNKMSQQREQQTKQ